MKDYIVKNLESIMMMHDLKGSTITVAKSQILGGERLDEDSQEIMYKYPWVVLDGGVYDVIKNSDIEYWVYDGNSPVCRFFRERHAIEYVLLKLGLL